MRTHVHSGITNSSRGVDATQASQGVTVVQPHNGISCSLKKEGQCDTVCDGGEARGHRAGWNKPVTKGQTAIPLAQAPRGVTCRETESRCWAPGQRGRGGAGRCLMETSCGRTVRTDGCATLWIRLMPLSRMLKNG